MPGVGRAVRLLHAWVYFFLNSVLLKGEGVFRTPPLPLIIHYLKKMQTFVRGRKGPFSAPNKSLHFFADTLPIKSH